MKNINFKKEEQIRKIKKFLNNPFFIVVFVLVVIFSYIEINRYLDNKAYVEAFYDYYGLNTKKFTEQQKEEWYKLAEAPFVIRSEKIQEYYNKCVEGSGFYCNKLADYELSQGHIRNYLNFLGIACSLSYDYCDNYADGILKYYSDKNLAKIEAIKYYGISCDNGDTFSCKKVKELNYGW